MRTEDQRQSESIPNARGRGLTAALGAAVLALALTGCAGRTPPGPMAGDAGTQTDESPTAVRRAVNDVDPDAELRDAREAEHSSLAVVGDALVATVEPWQFNGAAGKKFSLDDGTITLHTTGEKSWMHQYALQFAQGALHHYRSAIAELPAPQSPLEIFLFARRSEWTDQTRAIMGEHAELYLNLGRGGYTTRGMAILYDIGFNDTFTIMSHEGWHQYTQVTFKNPLPTWLEEGIATYMEGRRQSREHGVEFFPWANQQRLEGLRRAWKREELIRIPELIDRSPQHFLEKDSRRLLTYYSEVWAFVHFLMHGEDGKYRAALQRVLDDAAHGRLQATILSSPNIPNIERRRNMAVSSFGPGVLLAYFSRDYASRMQQEFDAFVERIFKDEDYLRDLIRDDMARLSPDADPEQPN